MDEIVHRVMRFDRFALDLTRGCLRSGGRDIELRPKTFEVLRHLAQNAGRLVSKEELFEAVWPNVVVGDDSLVQCIRELRQKLGDDEHGLIKTVSRRGYLLDAARRPPEATRPVQPAWTHLALKLREVSQNLTANLVALRQVMRGTPWRTLAAAACVLACAGTAGVYLLSRSMMPVGNRGKPVARASATAVIAHWRRPTFKDCDVCPEMVELPAGEFMMGSPESESGRDGNEGLPRRVLIAERVAVGKFEVTIDQFAAFVAETGFAAGDSCRAYVVNAQPTEWPLVKGSFRDPGFRATGMHPVVCVSWHDARSYAAWLSRKTAKPYRLPTEGEWEYAARAGTTTAYSFGNEVAKLCEFARFADGDSSFPWAGSCYTAVFEPGAFPAGTLAPNPWGLYDMHGNAWEWAEDCWTTDARLLPSDGSAYKRPGGCEFRATRGGGWISYGPRVRSAYRTKQPADARYNFVGFRVARPLGP
jgi:formylglycine-generating enzyme required for sulfatase activity/DNA-binding winged helix-turn-helix (wHTH) protein